MALKGTLRDFGIAEILQLIGQQSKSGLLHVTSRDDEIHITLAEGRVVGAESSGRQARDRLGNMLLRAEIITAEELAHALDVKEKSLRRLGDVLLELGYISHVRLKEMTALQTTETIYRLFAWETGDYEFEGQPVEFDERTVTPLRAEPILMEGFRQVDEWPAIRKKISSQAMTFEVLRTPEPEAVVKKGQKGSEEDEASFDDLGEGESKGPGKNERRVFVLARSGRTVEQIVNLSRLGEFETSRALFNLVNQGYLRALRAARKPDDADGEPESRPVLQVVCSAVLLAVLAALVYRADQRALGLQIPMRDNAVQRFLSRYQVSRLKSAVEVYRLERGELPGSLLDLVEAGEVTRNDLSHPFTNPYYYRRTPEGGFVLLPPFE